ncbi:MAG: CoA transferase [Azospirillaceae bacterium]|nr:CoA transferase [Azospirillaceae bacterium]
MKETTNDAFGRLLATIWDAVGGATADLERVRVIGTGDLPSAFAVTDLAAASTAAAGLAVSEFCAGPGSTGPLVTIDRRLASFWFATSLRPEGWSPPTPWDAIAGDYRAADGWIRLHTNAPAHRNAALTVLGVDADKDRVTGAVASWSADGLESAIVAAGGCAARLRSAAEWSAHPQGQAIAGAPLIDSAPGSSGPIPSQSVDGARPLAGLKVLDLTRVLAGPVASRFLAGYGATVLRIDPPDWDEPGVVPEVTLGKRTARLDLHRGDDHAQLVARLAEANVLIHGYRPDALSRLGLGADVRQKIRPGLVDITLNAYGWRGPWCGRRGFDSLVQMSSGLADAGMRHFGRDQPTPLPVQALDHATGMMMAAAAIRGLRNQRQTGRGVRARASLAATAGLLAGYPLTAPAPLSGEIGADRDEHREFTAWGPARRLRWPLRIGAIPVSWHRPASPLGMDTPGWGSDDPE